MYMKMEITVIIPSRGRVRGLNAALTTLRALESGRHRVHYGVCCDDDDIPTNIFCREMRAEFPHTFAYRMGPRPVTLGGVINDMAGRMPADLYFSLSDDMLCLTPNWDDIAAQAAAEIPHGVFFWKNALPADAHYCIVTEKWRQAAGGVFTDHYPYWFDDLALIEQYILATQDRVRHLDIYMADKPVRTHRMRELPFWMDFFTQTRALRVRKGREIAAKLGLPEPEVAEAIAEELRENFYKKRDDASLAEIEKNQGDHGPPDANYLLAKVRAAQILAEIQTKEFTNE